MTVWLLVICCLVGFAVWLSRPRKRVTAQGEQADNQPVSPYRGVAIKPGKNGCASARTLEERRFLALEAPRLPLPNCDATVCQCRYSHFEDRREHDRRSSHALARGLGSGTGNLEHRTGSDRRRRSGFPSHAI
jgi:hypothetical protein